MLLYVQWDEFIVCGIVRSKTAMSLLGQRCWQKLDKLIMGYYHDHDDDKLFLPVRDLKKTRKRKSNNPGCNHLSKTATLIYLKNADKA